MNNKLIAAAITGIFAITTPIAASADDHGGESNGCKGKAGEEQNSCKAKEEGKNSCKGASEESNSCKGKAAE